MIFRFSAQVVITRSTAVSSFGVNVFTRSGRTKGEFTELAAEAIAGVCGADQRGTYCEAMYVFLNAGGDFVAKFK